MVNTKVATVSQATPAPGRVSTKVPAALYGLPFQMYGSSLAQTATVVVVVGSGVMLRLRVATVSQATPAPGSVSTKVPAALYGLPFHINGSSLAQTATVVVVVGSGVMLKSRVATVSQAETEAINVSIQDP